MDSKKPHEQASRLTPKPKFVNPLFRKPEIARTGRWVRITLVTLPLAFVLLCITAIPTVIRNSDYYIKLAVFTGNSRMSDEQIVAETNSYLSGNYLLCIPKKNILFVPTNQLSEHLKSTFHLESITIDRIVSSRTLHMIVTEKPLKYILRIEQVPYYLAPDGTILETVGEVEGEDNPASEYVTIEITEEALISNEVQKKSIQTKLLDFISSAEQKTAQEDYVIQSVRLTHEDAQDIQLITNLGWYIYVDSSKSLDSSLSVVKEIYRQRKNSTENPIREYIDVRLPDRAYVK